MAFTSADDFAQQMIGQIRVLDPSISCEVGTPERKIIDTVAQTLSENQIDLTGIQSALDVDSAIGSTLDRFTALFGFQRQQATAAVGFVVFSRTTAAPENITIPTGTELQATTPNPDTLALGLPQFATTATGTIPIDETTSDAVPVQCLTAGIVGNVGANTITQMIGVNTPPGVTAVTNPSALTTGLDAEDDNSYKARFKNTWARNLAGTQDQYLALAVANTFTTKATALGTQSRFQEYFQIPDWDDAGSNSTNALIGDTFGVQNQWTTALSNNPYLKYVYANTGVFVSNGSTSTNTQFYRLGSDYQFNVPALLTGDTLREQPSAMILSTSGSSPNGVLTIDTTYGNLQDFPASGSLAALGSTVTSVAQILTYTGKTSTTLTGITGNLSTVTGNPVYLVPTLQNRPNFTFFNVNQTGNSAIQAVTPGQVVLAEYSYISQSSRNDLAHNVDNAVDVYIDGANDVQASVIFLPNFVTNQFSVNPNSPWYYENFRRDGQPAKRPQLNNWVTPLFYSPVDQLPATITVANNTYYLGYHYWLVHETGDLSGSIRARDGIEWSSQLNGDPGGQAPPYPGGISGSPLPINNPTGKSIYSATVNNTAIEVDNYLYDANVTTIQASFDQQKQITTDALVHRATPRYFKLDITVVYENFANSTVVNTAIQTAVQQYFQNQYFGSVIQLSTLLEIIHVVNGVNNVRWSNDLPNPPNAIRVYETDVNGIPLHGATIDRLVIGTSTVTEQQTLYVAGSPNGSTLSVPDYFALNWKDGSSVNNINHTFNFQNTNGTPADSSTWNPDLTTIMTPLPAPYAGALFSNDFRPTTNVNVPIRSFTLTYGANGNPVLPTVTNVISASTYAFNEDFYLLDHELPFLPTGQLSTDTLPGLIIRTRAQNTLYRPGLG